MLLEDNVITTFREDYYDGIYTDLMQTRDQLEYRNSTMSMDVTTT